MCNGLNSGVPLDLGAHGAYNYSWPKCFCSILCWGCAEADWEIEITDRGARCYPVDFVLESLFSVAWSCGGLYY